MKGSLVFGNVSADFDACDCELHDWKRQVLYAWSDDNVFDVRLCSVGDYMTVEAFLLYDDEQLCTLEIQEDDSFSFSELRDRLFEKFLDEYLADFKVVHRFDSE